MRGFIYRVFKTVCVSSSDHLTLSIRRKILLKKPLAAQMHKISPSPLYGTRISLYFSQPLDPVLRLMSPVCILTHYCSDTKFEITVASSKCSFISRFLTKSLIYFFSALCILYASPTSPYPWFDRNVIRDIIIFSPCLCYFLHRRFRYYNEHGFCVYPQITFNISIIWSASFKIEYFSYSTT